MELFSCVIIPSITFFFSGKQTLLEAIAERESIYRILGQTTPENTCKDFNSYTVDPITRYHRTMNRKLVSPYQIASLVDTDNPAAVSLSADVTVS